MGILGGTFNPPHVGHLALARHAHQALGLELVLMIPACLSPLKAPAQDPGSGHRLRMCRLAAIGVEALAVCGLEIERGGTSYTVDTLSALHERHPDARLTLITGADTARTLQRWREPQRLLELADLAVAAREEPWREAVLDTVEALLPAGRFVDGEAGAVRLLDMPAVEASSSMVRERVARGEEIGDLVPAPVAAYIAEHGLYRPAREAGG